VIYIPRPNKAVSHRPPLLTLPPFWSHRFVSLQCALPGCLAMASLSHGAPVSATQEQSVISEKHGDLEILVPEWLWEHSEELFDIQKRAINHVAVSNRSLTKVQTVRHIGWAFEGPLKLACFYLHIPPIKREQLHKYYPSCVPFSMIGFASPEPRVVGGIFGVPKNLWHEVPEPEYYFKMGDVEERHHDWSKRCLEEDSA
jgi:hypothetical protein